MLNKIIGFALSSAQVPESDWSCEPAQHSMLHTITRCVHCPQQDWRASRQLSRGLSPNAKIILVRILSGQFNPVSLVLSPTAHSDSKRSLAASVALEVLDLNVGGSLFTTTRSTLTRDPDSMLARMFGGSLMPALKDGAGRQAEAGSLSSSMDRAKAGAGSAHFCHSGAAESMAVAQAQCAQSTDDMCMYQPPGGCRHRPVGKPRPSRTS